MRQLLKTAVKSFADIPSPRAFPFIGHAYLFMPGGKYQFEKLNEAVDDLSKIYGDVFRLKLGSSNIIISVNPNDTETIFRKEGMRPVRPPFSALYHYRKKAFNSVGVVPGNGEEWYRLRGGVTPLLKNSLISKYIKLQKDVAKTFIHYIESNWNEHCILDDMWFHLAKFAIEMTSVISPGYRFRVIEGKDSKTDIIMKASNDFMDGLYKTLMGPPIWKIYKTTPYKQLENSHQAIYGIMEDKIKYIQSQYVSNPDAVREENPFMFTLLSNEKLSTADCIMLAMEIFLGGIDTTATTSAFTFYYLARNKDIQQKAREEVYTGGSNFLKACIKETLRLSPPAGGISRFLPQDAVIGGYCVPKDTLVSVFNSVTSVNERYFNNPNIYDPSRWIRDTKEEFHKFASLPFSHGARMCPGKRLVENEIVILLKEVLQNFDLDNVNEDEVGMVFRMNRVPDKPIIIKFTKRNY